MAIGDRDLRKLVEGLRDAADEFTSEIENLEDQVTKLEAENKELTDKCDGLIDQVKVYEDRIKELEEALAEAYLTSERVDEFQRETTVIPTGHRPDVLDTTGNKAAD